MDISLCQYRPRGQSPILVILIAYGTIQLKNCLTTDGRRWTQIKDQGLDANGANFHEFIPTRRSAAIRDTLATI
jgi:hypothetical protein